MSVDRHANRIALGVRVFCILALVGVLVRVFQLQAFPSQDLRMALDGRTTGSRIDAVRGDLLDRRGRVLATTRIGWRVIVDPVVTGDKTDAVIVSLSEQLGVRGDDIGSRVMRAAIENTRRRAAMQAEPDAAVATEQPQGFLAGLGLTPPRPAENPDKGLVRYVPVSDIITGEEAAAIRALKLPGVGVERRSVREIVGGQAIAPLVGKVGYKDMSDERAGLMGAERLFQENLEGVPGSLEYVRDAKGRPLWVERGDWKDADPGEPVRLSIDAEIQRIVAEELERGVVDADAAGGRAIVLDPHTGEILAMVDLVRDVPGTVEVPWHDPASGKPWPTMPEGVRFKVIKQSPGVEDEPAMARNRCVEDVYEPGSTFKPFVWALAHELGRFKPGEVIRTETRAIRTHYGRRLEDVTFKPELTWDDVLRFSSNIGMYHATERLSHQELHGVVRRLGFGSRTGLGLPGETGGLVTDRRDWSKYTQTSVGMGYEVGVTPVQMVRAFSVFARRGDESGTMPGIRLTAAGIDDRPGLVGEEVFIERVFEPADAEAVREPLQAVVERMDKFRLQRDPKDVAARYTMFGKSGTAYIACTPPKGLKRPRGAAGYFRQYNSSFLVAAPAEDPALVVLVVIDDPGPEAVRKREHYGSAVAGPVVRRLVERVLPYLGVPPPGVAEVPSEDPN